MILAHGFKLEFRCLYQGQLGAITVVFRSLDEIRTFDLFGLLWTDRHDTVIKHDLIRLFRIYLAYLTKVA